VNPEQLLARVRTLLASFSTSQLVTLGLTFVLVVGIIVGSTWFIQKPSYTLLFADMDAESAGQVVTRLKSMKVDYQLDEGGGAIRVPANRVDELRLELTSQGLPSSGRIGFEIFDRTAFGATEFIEKVNYRRALEGEIARTIATLSEVAGARVHIAMGKETVFGEPRPAKASVVLKLRNKRGLSAASVAGITGLVAGSVEGLRPESVVIVDNYGRPLAQQSADASDPLGAAQLERQQRLEQDMATRVVALLEPVVGPDRVRVNVAIKLNAASRQETEERWDPNTVMRSRQMSSDTSGATAAAGMIAGARGNMPPPPTPPGGQPPPLPGQQQAAVAPIAQGPSRNQESTTYEVSRLTRHTISPAGDVARLSLAVILDDTQVVKKEADGTLSTKKVPRTREELQKVQALVSAAVGLDAGRGDQLTVEHMSFDDPPEPDIEEPGIVAKLAPQVTEASRIAVVLAIGFAAFLLVVRPMMRRAGIVALPAMQVANGVALPAGSPLVAGPGGAMVPRTVAELESEIEAQLDAQLSSDQTPDTLRVPVLTRRVAAMSQKEPENVARLLRLWMREKER
jgi:flagellar M-ring protein FliF